MAYQHYTYSEQDDAEKVDRAIALIDAGQADEARKLLEQVVAHCPELYIYDFGDQGEVYIKFWSLSEYLGYVALTRKPGEEIEQEVIWLKSAYPRAHYYLAKLALTAGDDAAAAAHLDRALSLEPDHPECLLEIAEMSARAGDAAKAVEQFDIALGSRPYMPANAMTRLLAGKAKQLAQLGRYEEAERCLQESLKRGADGELAMNTEQYVESMKAGDVTAPVSVDAPAQEKNPVPLEPGEPLPGWTPQPEDAAPLETPPSDAAPTPKQQAEPGLEPERPRRRWGSRRGSQNGGAAES